MWIVVIGVFDVLVIYFVLNEWVVDVDFVYDLIVGVIGLFIDEFVWEIVFKFFFGMIIFVENMVLRMVWSIGFDLNFIVFCFEIG